MNVALFSLLALLAFAGNSVLCRLALGRHLIDAASFTGVRLIAGAAMLLAIRWGFAPRAGLRPQGSWWAAGMLFAYAAAFSFAYVTLPTATGALLLFGAVQLTMVLDALATGHRMLGWEWAGLMLAFSGLLSLALPGYAAPTLAGFLLMSLAGVAWGAYTLLGRRSIDPLADTAGNFLRALPMLGLLLPAAFHSGHATPTGILWAALSGAVTSGLGYTIWYRALPNLTAAQAATMQLSVPMLAAFGGVGLLGEPVTLRLVLASILILGGIALVIQARTRAKRLLTPRFAPKS